MFSQVFLFFLECFGKIINVFKNFKIDTNLTYFDFLVFSAAVLLLFQLLRVVREESNEDDRFYRRMQRYDEYKKRKKEENSDDWKEVLNNEYIFTLQSYCSYRNFY